MTRPSFADYGTYDESAHPDLWDGVVGYWSPCLGPTGTRLHDVSRFNNWGTLTNMDAATDWVIDGGQYALDGDGTDDIVPTQLRLPTSRMSYGGWVNIRNFKSGFTNRPFGEADNASGSAGSCLILFNTGLYAVFRGGSATDINATSAVTTSTNVWYHWMVTLGDAPRVYQNGRLIATGSGTTIASWNKGFKLLADDDAGPSTTIDGRVDDVAVWNRALTPNEIIRLYNLGRGGMLERRRRRRFYSVQADVVRSYLFVNRGQLIGGGTL